MPRSFDGTIRQWQTGLFFVVIALATLILIGSLSAGLNETLSSLAEASEMRNASALARRLEPDVPVSVESLDRVRSVLIEYQTIYGSSAWIFDSSGALLESTHQGSPPRADLEAAVAAAMADDRSYAVADLRSGGWVVASRALIGPGGQREGVLVTASSVGDFFEILGAVRYRIWVSFWISLLVAGLVGYVFAGLIGRRIQAMAQAASAIEAGDFEQRLGTGFVPAEIQELATSYNNMAAELGAAFGSLRESQRQIATVVDSMAEGVVALDASATVRVLNREADRLLELDGADFVGADVSRVTRSEELTALVRAALRGESGVSVVTLGRLVVRSHCTPLVDASGRVEGAVLLLADVTEQRRSEEAQRRFVSDASHELRTPIAAIKGMLELLEDGAKDDARVRDDFIHTMQVEVERLGRLVGDLLTLARLEAGTLELKVAPSHAAHLLGDVASVMHTLAEDAGVTLAVDLPNGDVRVLADHDRVVQVLLSFTDNALKHSPPGAHVHLRAQRVGTRVRLEVSDEGAGIAADELDRVFERFYRSDLSRAGKGGAGLGLAIAKEIVEAHGSFIEVRSVPGTGTTFGFELPLA